MILYLKNQTGLIHTWRNTIILPWEDTELLSLGNCIEGANYMKQKQFNCNEWNFTFVKLDIFDEHMKGQSYLALGRHRITLLGKLYQGCQQHETNAI